MWAWDTIFEGSGASGAATNRSDMDGVTMVIGSVVNVDSGTDCGSFVGEWSRDEDGVVSFAFPEIGISCENAEAISILLTGLTDVASSTVDENRLTLLDAAGDPRLGFVAGT